VSYNIEQARGDDTHNILTVVMRELKIDLEASLTWVCEYHEQLERKFYECCDKIPRWGEPIDSEVARYCEGLGNWVRANDQWSFESGRYFGKRGLEIMKSRWVTLMPKVDRADVGPLLVST
jgi:Delta6-protoilludene synthase